MLRVNTPRLSGFLHCAATLTLVWACSSDDKTPTGAGGGDGSTAAGAPSDAGAAGMPESTGGSSNPTAGASAAGEGGAAAGGGGAAGAGGDPAQPECVEPSDCVVPETNPAGCAEATCNEGTCAFSARDGDGDGFLAKRCQSLEPGIDITKGDDCDDADDSVSPSGWDGPAGDGHANGCNDQIDQDCSGIVDDQVLPNAATCTCSPGDTEPCASTASGLPIDYPVKDNDDKPVGQCKLGSRECLPNGTWGACTNAKGPTPEVCDNLDNNCNSLLDDQPTDPHHFYCDADNDQFLAANAPAQVACTHSGACAGNWLTDPALPVFQDCDDADSKNFPGPKTQEVCDGGDNNCDGIVDGKNANDDLKTTFYRDQDGDGIGTDASATLVCKSPGTGWVLSGGDCQDTGAGAASVHVGADEVCNGKDDDCDGDVDTADAGLKGKPTQANTTYACQGGEWIITGCPTDKLDCDGGLTCETDATSVDSCRACNVTCHLACGAVSCEEATALSAGAEHTCAVTSAGRAVCWGRNDKGQLGDGSATERHQPSDVVTIAGVKASDGGGKQSCAIVGASNNLYCWGSDALGQLGSVSSTGASDPNSAPVVVQDDASVADMSGVSSVSTGTNHTCAIHGGVVACWGEGVNGKLGDGDTSAHSAVKAGQCLRGPAGSETFVTDGLAVAAGESHTCLLRSNKTVDCWGDNSLGQLGGGAIASTGLASAVSGLSNVTALSAGRFHTCALVGGQVYCWGNNGSNQVGQAAGASYDTPQLVSGLSGVTAVAAGGNFTCVIAGGAVQCWGANGSGQRGDANAASSSARTTLAVGQPTALAAGSLHACALTSTKQVYCWGENLRGQLGNGSAAAGANPTPQTVLSLL